MSLFPTNQLPDYSSDFVISVLNKFPVHLYEFGKISNMFSTVFAVYPVCEDTAETAQREWDNACLQDQIWLQLWTTQVELQRLLPVSMYSRYVVERVNWDGISPVRLNYNEITKLNVDESFTSVGSGSLNYITELTLSDSGHGFAKGSLHSDYTRNILKAMFRREVENNGLTTYENINDAPAVAGYPNLNVSNWEFAFDGTTTLDDTVYYQDCEFAYIDIDPVDDKSITDIVFRYSNNQIIRYSYQKIVTVDEDTKWRYWFSVYQLKKYEFNDILISMNVSNPFQYFLTSLEYGYWEEGVQYAKINYYDTRYCTSSNFDLQTMDAVLRMWNHELGLIEVIPVTVDGSTVSERYLKSYEQPVSIDAYYKVSTTDTSLNIPTGVDSLRKAIAAKSAANIDHNWCNCHLDKDSYIAKMQEELPTVIQTPLGGALTNFEFGSRYGDRLYAHFVQSLAEGSNVYVK